jgi:hypothetical protein
MGGWQYTNSFVIQFRADGEIRARVMAGRIEHIASSRTAHFHSLDELLTFINGVLRETRSENHEPKEDRP